MKACAPMLVATWTNFGNDVTHWKAFVRLLSVDQWYSSESEPPGPRSVWAPISLSSEIVCAVSKLLSQMAVLKPNQREATERTAWVALRLTWTIARAGL